VDTLYLYSIGLSLLWIGNHTKQVESQRPDQLHNAIYYKCYYKYQAYVEVLPISPLTLYTDNGRLRLLPLCQGTETPGVLRKKRACYLKIWAKY
jgi:hypothetical protein